MKNKYLHRLGFRVTDEFLETSEFNRYSCGEELIATIDLIKSYAKEILKKEWMADNVLKLPYILNAINPVELILKEDIHEERTVELYCHSSLSKTKLDRMVYLITNNIEEFIEKNREGLEQFNSTVNLNNVNINLKSMGIVDRYFFRENLTLIKVLFIRQLTEDPIFIGTSKEEKYLDEGRKVKFYPSYSRQGGHMLISEIIDIYIDGKFERMAYYITPNVVYEDGEIFIYPLIGVKRMVSYKRLKSIQNGTADSYSTLIFDGKAYYSPRIAYRKSKKAEINDVQMVYQDWKLYKHLEEFKGFTFKDIKEHIEGEDKKNIYLVYSNKLGNNHKLNSGVPSCDKLDIYNHVKISVKGLEPIDVVKEIKRNNKFGMALDNTDKLVLSNTIYKNYYTDIEVLVIHPPASTLYDATKDVIESGKLIKNNIGLTIRGDDLYYLQTSDKRINLTVRDISSVVGLEIKADNETSGERLKKIIDEIGEKSPNKLTLALIELENMGKYDAKFIIRKALDSYGIINQFIDSKTGINANKIASGLKDLLNDIGLGNLNQSIGEDEVIYTLHKASKINFICRLNNNIVEVKIPGVTGSYFNITDIYPILNGIKDKIEDIKDIDLRAIEEFIQDINEEMREVIVVLEGGETQYNTITYNLSSNLEERIKSHVKAYITTDLLGYQEVIQTMGNRPTLGSGIYKIKEGTYISIGDKGKDKTSVEASKIRSWKNKYNKKSIGATIAYKDRIAYEVNIHKDKDNDYLCELIHRLRFALTTHSHLNRCITTDYILGLEKHLQ